MSSDMNPIEHVWDCVSRAIFNRNNPPRSTQELIVAAIEEWDNIPQEAYELSTLTGTQVMLLVASETGHVYTFATRKLQPMITSEAGKYLIGL
nr:unnamed protein product [Callosobruchus chinensis]